MGLLGHTTCTGSNALRCQYCQGSLQDSKLPTLVELGLLSNANLTVPLSLHQARTYGNGDGAEIAVLSAIEGAFDAKRSDI